MNIETLANLPNFYLPTLSHGRRWVAYYAESLDLMLLDLNTGERQLLALGGAIPDRPLPFVWARDDRAIYFPRASGGTEAYDVYRIDIESGAVTPITTEPEAADYPLDIFGDQLLLGSTRSAIPNLFMHDLSSGRTVQLTHFQRPVQDAMFSDDGKYVVFTANASAVPRNVDLWVMRPDGKKQEIILSTSEQGQDGFSDWVKGRVAIHSDAGGVRRAGVLAFKSQQVRWLSPEDGNYWPGKLSPNGRYLVAYLNQDAAISPILLHTKTGKVINLDLPPGIAYGGQWLSDEALLLTLETDTRRRSLYVYDTETRHAELILAADYGDIDPASFAPHEYVHYTAADGSPIPALLYRPQEAATEARPAVVYLHGGPTAQFYRDFDIIAQVLVAEGFVVLMPNQRGSTGYGNAHRDAIVLDWGGVDLNDVLDAGDYLKGLADVDAERVGIFGGSYGGFLTLLAMTKAPGHFKAGVAFNAISDLLLLDAEATPQYREVLHRFMGKPERYIALWKERSAVNFAEQLGGKLLIVHGENDPRVPLSQAIAMRDALKAGGATEGPDFEWIVLSDEGHSRQDILGRATVLTLLSDFFKRRL